MRKPLFSMDYFADWGKAFITITAMRNKTVEKKKRRGLRKKSFGKYS